MKFLFIANAAVGKGLSGSDRIFIELARRWQTSGHQVTVAVWEDGYDICHREGLINVAYTKWFLGRFKHLPFLINYVLRILTGMYYALSRQYQLDSNDSYIYACSDFWQDTLPAFILKLRYPNAKLIGSFYLAAPNPFVGFYEGKRLQIPSLKSVLYYLQQQPIYLLLKRMADYIFITSEPDTKRFPRQSKQGRVVVVKGGVDLQKVQEWQSKIGAQAKTFEAVFLGRFHPQKGVLELVDIWERVTKVLPTAQLVMMGDGPLFSECKTKIQQKALSNNITLTGYQLDGESKYAYFAKSKIALHPAVYDSGGMAAAEAMAWGLPAVSFDLEALKTYYPMGMIKVPFGDYQTFANTIIALLQNPTLYEKTKFEALNLITNEWSWDSRAQKILTAIQGA